MVLGVEPEDIVTHSVELTPAVAARVDDVAARVLDELRHLGVTCRKRSA